MIDDPQLDVLVARHRLTAAELHLAHDAEAAAIDAMNVARARAEAAMRAHRQASHELLAHLEREP